MALGDVFADIRVLVFPVAIHIELGDRVLQIVHSVVLASEMPDDFRPEAVELAGHIFADGKADNRVICTVFLDVVQRVAHTPVIDHQAQVSLERRLVPRPQARGILLPRHPLDNSVADDADTGVNSSMCGSISGSRRDASLVNELSEHPPTSGGGVTIEPEHQPHGVQSLDFVFFASILRISMLSASLRRGCICSACPMTRAHLTTDVFLRFQNLSPSVAACQSSCAQTPRR